MQKAKLLIIAGTDPTSGAGISVDIATASYFNVKAAIAVTAINIQNDQAVTKMRPIEPALLHEQIECAINSCDIKAIKIGMIGSLGNKDVIKQILLKYKLPVILDPVMRASSGGALAEANFTDSICDLLPHITLLTPNLMELAELSNSKIAGNNDEAIEQADSLMQQYKLPSILIKGGHARYNKQALDILLKKNQAPQFYYTDFMQQSKRGTGCALACAIAAHIIQGNMLEDAVKGAKLYIQKYIIDQ